MHSSLAIWCAFICFTTTTAFVKNDTELLSHTFKIHEKEYVVNLVEANFDDALAFCNASKLQLVAIKDHTENNKIVAELINIGVASHTQFWTSGTKLAKSDDWIWLSTGELITVYDWGDGQPSDNTTDFCLSIYADHYNLGTWNDERCDTIAFFICETIS